jgi:hypothetical protein
MLKATGDSGTFHSESPDLIVYEKPKQISRPTTPTSDPDEEGPSHPTLESIPSLDPELGELLCSDRPTFTLLT